MPPVEVGGGYRDYMFRDIADSLGLSLEYAALRFDGCVMIRIVGSSPSFVSTSIFLYPAVAHDFPYRVGYDDVRVRYFEDDSDPVWVALYWEGKEAINLLSRSK